jgi:hypothetical protein
MNENDLNKLIPNLVEVKANLPKRGGRYISDADKKDEDARVDAAVARARRAVREEHCDCQKCDCQRCDCQRCDCQSDEESSCNC